MILEWWRRRREAARLLAVEDEARRAACAHRHAKIDFSPSGPEAVCADCGEFLFGL